MDEQTNNEYGIKVAMFISDPKYSGTISEEEAKELGASLFSYTYGDQAIGYSLTLHWAINTHENTIVLARYTYEGVPVEPIIDGITRLDRLLSKYGSLKGQVEDCKHPRGKNE